jgi:hypothetical protein
VHVQSDLQDACSDGRHVQIDGIAWAGLEVEQRVICPGPVWRVDLQHECRNLLGERTVCRHRLDVLEHRVGGPAGRERDGARSEEVIVARCRTELVPVPVECGDRRKALQPTGPVPYVRELQRNESTPGRPWA